MIEDWRHGGFGLYLHWPFCAAKCPYCDFNSHVATSIDQKRWERAYLAEIDRAAEETPGRVLNSVFFGGGTPSLMNPDLVAAILDKVRRSWPMANDIEITLEANPTSIEAGRFQGYSDAGVNRISMGMQALNDTDLRKLGRMHTAAEGRRAFDIARSRFDRVSFDLIYARQDQDLLSWEQELREAISMAVDHFSLYQLTIEDGTAFGKRAAIGKLKGLPNEDLGADMYLKTQEICESAGLNAYEVSNHARLGSECRHNLIYWHYGDYIGIGPGAHGRLSIDGRRYATETPLAPSVWLDSVEQTRTGESKRYALTTEDEAVEFLLFGLRLSEGIDIERYHTLSGNHLDAAKIAELSELGLVDQAGSRLRATANGRAVLNGIIRELMP